jgi:4-aminobutyrate aminotransferase-like enzyme
MSVTYQHCSGAELFTADGRCILDFLSGYCVHYTGHNHPYMQVLVMRMFREKNILTQICGNNFMVLKAAPPLVVSEEQLDAFVAAICGVVELAHTSASFWSEALGLARRAVNI